VLQLVSMLAELGPAQLKLVYSSFAEFRSSKIFSQYFKEYSNNELCDMKSKI